MEAAISSETAVFLTGHHGLTTTKTVTFIATAMNVTVFVVVCYRIILIIIILNNNKLQNNTNTNNNNNNNNNNSGQNL